MSESNGTRGILYPIGGGEAKIRNRDVLRRFVDVCGGERACIGVVPTASRTKDIGKSYVDVFKDLGAGESRSLNIRTRRDCHRSEWLDFLAKCTGVFLTGGNQLRLSTTVGGTPFSRSLRKRFERGMHVGGTSAGAAVLSEHMIAFGDEGATPRSSMVNLAPGFGLTQELIIDQHFRQRDRLGRLVTALAYNPYAIGVGLDEDTAALITPDDMLEVYGSGGLTIVDPRDVEFSSMDSAHPDDPVSVIGMHLHILIEGSTYNIASREAHPAPAASGKV